MPTGKIKMCSVLHLSQGSRIRVEHSREEVNEIMRKGNVELPVTLSTGNGTLSVMPKLVVAIEEFPIVAPEAA